MKLAFVIPWFGADLPGGAEAVCYAVATRLHAAGFPVEVLTTCVRQLRSDWARNHHPPGEDRVGALPVRRFPVQARDAGEFQRINTRLIERQPVTADEEQTFLREMIRCDALTAFIERHRADYAFAYIPYLFSTTYWGARAAPESSILIPCLHDEGYAYLSPFRPVFENARGVVFHSREEGRLASRLFRLDPERQALVGTGVERALWPRPERFRRKYGLDRFLLYVGRRDEGKNVPLLVDHFCRYQDRFRSDLKLVLIGDGPLTIPDGYEADILDLGRVSAQEKVDAYGAALALCQPSLNESFSLVLMEAWLAGTPALVHAECAVTRDHCLAASGGLYFASADDFAGALEFFRAEPATARRMGAAGRRYVQANFTWDAVVSRYRAALRGWGFAL
jgi:glycosyltransferase involved in cell wall biosynthesis